MSIIIEKIKKIINKIDENVPKELDQKEVKKLLNYIDDELAEVKDSVEENQKEIVNSKIEELRSEIDKGRNKEWKWGRVKDFLKDDVKGGLNELKDEITESQKLKKDFTIEHGSTNDTVKIIELEKTLAKWEMIFPGQTPEEASASLKKLWEEIIKHENEVKNIVKKAAKESNSPSLIELNKSISQGTLDIYNISTKTVQESGLGVMASPAAFIASFFVANLRGAATAGIYVGEEIGSNVVDLTKDAMNKADDARKDLKGFSEHIADNTRDVFNEGMKDATEVTKSVAADFFGMFNKKETIKSLQGKIELLEKLLDEAKEQTKQKDEEIEKLRERKNKEIKELQERKDKQIEKLQERITSLLDNKLTAQVEQAPAYDYGNQ